MNASEIQAEIALIKQRMLNSPSRHLEFVNLACALIALQSALAAALEREAATSTSKAA